MQDIYLRCGIFLCLWGTLGYGIVLWQLREDWRRWGIPPHRNHYLPLCFFPLPLAFAGPLFIWLATQ